MSVVSDRSPFALHELAVSSIDAVLLDIGAPFAPRRISTTRRVLAALRKLAGHNA